MTELAYGSVTIIKSDITDGGGVRSRRLITVATLGGLHGREKVSRKLRNATIQDDRLIVASVIYTRPKARRILNGAESDCNRYRWVYEEWKER